MQELNLQKIGLNGTYIVNFMDQIHISNQEKLDLSKIIFSEQMVMQLDWTQHQS